MTNHGNRLYDIVASLNPKMSRDSHSLQRATGRLIEEVVELCMATKMTPQVVMTHVMDAIYNECRKVKRYPGMFVHDYYGLADRDGLKGELADVAMLVDYVRFLASVSYPELLAGMEQKIAKLDHMAQSGELVILDTLLYKRSAR